MAAPFLPTEHGSEQVIHQESEHHLHRQRRLARL